MRVTAEVEWASETAQKRRRIVVSRRANLDAALSLAVAFLLISLPCFAQKRREAILRLRHDVSTAAAHTSLNQKQTQTLDRSRRTLLLASRSGRARKMVTAKDLHGALRDIEKTVRSVSVPEEDRKLVMEDIERVRVIEQNRQERRAARAPN